MIKGVHTMFYSSKPEELRVFIRDKLRFPFTDVGDGWLIFDLPEADMGCHPAEEEGGPQEALLETRADSATRTAWTMKRCGARPSTKNGWQVTSVSVGPGVGSSTCTSSGDTIDSDRISYA